MVSKVKVCELEDFMCDECGMVYHDLETAVRCEDFCRRNHACSLEITSKAAHKPVQKSRGNA